MRFASQLSPRAIRPEGTRIDSTFSEIVSLFSRKKCGCGRTARATLSNSLGGVKPNLLDKWNHSTRHCELPPPRFPSHKCDAFAAFPRRSFTRSLSEKCFSPRNLCVLGFSALNLLRKKSNRRDAEAAENAARSIFRQAPRIANKRITRGAHSYPLKEESAYGLD